MSLMTYEEWFDAGGTRRRLERALADGELRRLRRSVLVVGTTGPSTALAEHLLRVRAAAPFLGERTVFSRFSAAAIHGLPVLRHRLAEVTVVRAGGGHGSISPTIHARHGPLPEEDQTLLGGLPVTSLARTVADLVRELPFDEGVMVADAGLRRGLDCGELLLRVADRRGSRRGATAISFADPDAESAGESLSRAHMALAGLMMPVLQQVVTDRAGGFVARGDFYWEHCRTIGEFDGRVKYDELATTTGASRVVMDEKRREE